MVERIIRDTKKNWDFCRKALPHYLLIFLCHHREMYYYILYTFCVSTFYPDNFGSLVPSCFSYHVFSHVLLFNCHYEVTLVVPLPPLGCVFNLHTRPLFKFAFIFNTCMSQPNFPFSAVIFYRRIFSSDSPDGLVVFPISFLASILNFFTPLVW